MTDLRSSAKLRPLLLRLWRIAALAALALLAGWQARRADERARPASVRLEEARLLFPHAAALSPAAVDGSHAVYDAGGAALGSVVRTSPQADRVIGYSGPNDLLIALDPQGVVRGVHLLRSGDTPDHIAMVEKDADFLRQFAGRKPGSAFPKIEAVSGATLTSSAIAEAVQTRLAGGAPSLRFPEKVTLEEVRALFPAAAALTEEAGRLRVTGKDGKLLGFAVRTSPAADSVAGYRGPTESLVALEPDGKTIAGVRLRRSYDTESYVQQIREDEWYLAGFKGRIAEQMAVMDFAKEGIEGVSGATQTSWAVAEGMKRTFAAKPPPKKSWLPALRDWLAAGVVCGALVMAFTRLRGVHVLRITWQALVIGWALWSGGDLLSLALLAGWAQHGIPWAAAPGAALIAGVALVIPWTARRQIYCHHICPHGAAQQWLGKLRRRKFAVPRPLDRALRLLPWVLLAAALVMILLRMDLAKLEPFDAWVWRAAALVALAIGVAGLVASVFIPQAYCRYGCPTGALLAFVRSSGAQDRFGKKDGAFCVLLTVAGVSAAVVPFLPAGESGDARTTVRGSAMGSSWEVTVRPDVKADELQHDVAARLEEIESELSHWRAASPVSTFNAARSMDPQAVPARVATLVRLAAIVSEASSGAFDITAGPLVKLWGFGPGPRRDKLPSEEEIAGTLAHTGWGNLTAEGATLRKNDPLSEIDLSAIGEGHAADEIAALLESRGVREFLINVSGELRARGTWAVAIEHPLRTIILKDGALATSGIYRQSRELSGQRVSHLMDARTGRPITHQTVSVSVRHADTVLADAWATALNVLGREEGLPLAERLGLAAEFVEEREGELAVEATSAWRAPAITR